MISVERMSAAAPTSTGHRIEERLAELAKLLTDAGRRFDGYQAMPAAVLRRAPEVQRLEYRQNQLGLDEPRYTWFRSHFRSRGVTVADIGGNIGYFAISFAAELGANATLYEPIEAHREICRLLAEIAGVVQIRTVDREIGLDNVSELPTVDLVVHLNVLHHAGTLFDVEHVAKLGGWTQYAERYLEALSKRARQLFFQTGNISSGSAHFSGADTLRVLHGLLDRSGWEVLKVGIIEDFSRRRYVTYDPQELAAAPVVTCWRNSQTNLVDYSIDGTVVASLPKGAAQRPLWLCCSRNRP